MQITDSFIISIWEGTRQFRRNFFGLYVYDSDMMRKPVIQPMAII